jgi:hypothetical protein
VIDFNVDITLDEMRRRAHVMEAADDLDPARMLADEAEAYRRLYSDLDDRQQEIYQMLVEQGVLPQ